MLVEKSAFEANPAAEISATSNAPGRGHGLGKGRGRGRGGATGRGGKKQGKDYAVNHGVKRGSFKGADDAVPPRDDYTFTDDMPREGLYVLIQATVCRRTVLARVFENPPHSELLFLVSPHFTDVLHFQAFPRLSAVISATQNYSIKCVLASL